MVNSSSNEINIDEMELVLQTLAMPASSNANGDIFGGWVLSQMDLGAGILAKKISQSRVATIALDSISFHQPIHIGDLVSCYAKLLKVGNTSMQIALCVVVTRDATEQKDIVTRGIFTFVAINREGRPQPVDPKKRQQ